MDLLDLFVKIGVKDEASDAVSNIGTKLKTGLATAGKVAAAGIGAVTTAAGAAVTGLLALEGATEEYRIAQGKLNTAYEAAGYSADTAQQAYKGFYEILGDTDTATEASQLLAKLAENQEDVATWTNIAAGVNGTFGDSLPIEGLIEASNETAKVGTVTGVLADALNWAGISEDEFNLQLAACSDESERNQLIMETLAGTYDEASDAFYRNNESIVAARDSQIMMDQALATLGQTVSDVKNRLMAEFVPALANVATSFSDMLSGVEGADEEFADAVGELVDSAVDYLPEFLNLGAQIIGSVLSGIIQSVPSIVAAIPSALAEIGAAIANAIGVNVDSATIESAIWNLVSAFQNLLPAVTGVTAAVIAYKAAMGIAALVQGVSQAVTAFKTANEGATVAQAALNAIMNANPFVLVATLIAGVSAALITLWATNEDFRAAVTEIWTTIGTFFQTVIGAIVGFFTETVPNAIQTMLLWFQNLPSNIWNALVNVVKSVAQWVLDMSLKVDDLRSQVIDKIVGFFEELPDKMLEIGKNIVTGLWEGIQSMIGWIGDKVSGFLGGIVDGAKSFLGIHSPSTVFADMGKNMALGLGEGWSDSFEGIKRGITGGLDFGTASVDFASSGLGMSSAGIVNGLSGAARQTGGNYTLNLMLPDGRVLASYVFNPLVDYAKANGTPILNPT